MKKALLAVTLIVGVLIGIFLVVSPKGFSIDAPRGNPGGQVFGVNNAKADPVPSASAAPSVTAAPSATPTATAAPLPPPAATTTNPKPVPGSGQPSVKDVENGAAITAKCASIPATLRHALYAYGVEQGGGTPVVFKLCGNPNFLTERRGSYSIDSTTLKMGVEGDRQTCGPVKPWDTGAQPMTPNEWTSDGDTLTEVNFKRFEGGTGTLINWQIVPVSACTGSPSPFVAAAPPPPPAEKKSCGSSCCGSGCGGSKPAAPAPTIIINWPAPVTPPAATTAAPPSAPKVDPNPYLGKP